jgi:hypothetical protein
VVDFGHEAVPERQHPREVDGFDALRCVAFVAARSFVLVVVPDDDASAIGVDPVPDPVLYILNDLVCQLYSMVRTPPSYVYGVWTTWRCRKYSPLFMRIRSSVVSYVTQRNTSSRDGRA